MRNNCSGVWVLNNQAYVFISLDELQNIYIQSLYHLAAPPSNGISYPHERARKIRGL